MYAIILCGGSGTRLWPLSRKNFPKPFLKLYSEKSLIQETFERMSGAISKENIYIVTDNDNLFNVFNQIKEIYPEFKKEQIVIELISRDTTPAIMLAVKYLQDKIGIDKNDPIIEVHSDHYIGKKEVYLDLVKKSLKALGNNIGLIGITPTKPDTGLGYIEKGEKEGDHYKVSAFKEKPDVETATKFLETKKYVWNAGMYMFNAKTFGEELSACDPEMYALYAKPFDEFVANFEKLPKIAIDYVLAEKSKRVIVFEGDFDWSDIGSFDVLSEIATKNDKINTKHLAFDSKNVYTNSASNRLIVTVGIDDINVVENNDVILVQKKGKSAEIKEVVEYLKKHDYKEVNHQIVEHRPWGVFEVLFESPQFKVKKFVVNPQTKLSLQSHKFRSEHWVVVKGSAKIVKNDEVIILKEGESAFVPQGTIHSFQNPTNENAEFVEVQLGSYLGEDDIVRYKDEYGRFSGVAML
jgi:mannose-1-phosphate guanylyltransferase / mannose-6-phosphate isomerase